MFDNTRNCLPCFGRAGQNEHFNSSDQTAAYITCLYWSVVTLSTVGYGDVVPISSVEKLFVLFAAILGSLLYSALFGTVTVIISGLNKEEGEYLGKVRNLKRFAAAHNIPPALRKKAIRYLDGSWKLYKGFDRESMFKLLPPKLVRDMRVALLMPARRLTNCRTCDRMGVRGQNLALSAGA